jgi:tetratricopeptide (TPR) repeat protein
MFDFDSFEDMEDPEDGISEAFVQWDDEQQANAHHGYYDAGDLCEILETYLSMDEVDEAREVVKYALRIHPEDEDMVCDILQIFNEYELWNDQLTLAENYKKCKQVWIDGQRIIALLHLGMEDEAFVCFGQAKSKYARDKESSITLYRVMTETLNDVDLYESSIHVVNDFLKHVQTADDVEDFLWVLLQSYFALDDKENTMKLCEQILRIKPMDADTWNRLGMVYKDLHEKEKAIEAFEFAVSLGKDEPVDILNLIYAYKENGNYLKALEKTDEFLKTSSNDYIINLLAANIAIEIEDWERTLKYTDNALESDPNADFLYLYKSKSLLQLGEIKKAINALEEGLKRTLDETGEIRKQLKKLRRKYPEYRKK